MAARYVCCLLGLLRLGKRGTAVSVPCCLGSLQPCSRVTLSPSPPASPIPSPYTLHHAGGDGSYTDTCTLPNILKAFNGTAGERLAGAATGSDLLQCVVDPEGNCGLDTAISGSTSYSLTGQAKTLVANLKRLKDVDVAKDWKMVTIFIGGNDLCAVCTDATTYSAAKYSDNLEAALDVLQANLPRTFVSVVGVVDVGLAAVLSDNLPRTLMCVVDKERSEPIQPSPLL